MDSSPPAAHLTIVTRVPSHPLYHPISLTLHSAPQHSPCNPRLLLPRPTHAVFPHTTAAGPWCEYQDDPPIAGHAGMCASPACGHPDTQRRRTRPRTAAGLYLSLTALY
ncbi:hypothetical protein EJ06DRAFT_269561 [Trichodelitschia bisporula]|uniref:Uncharacterized protein n=1 Tax=Trichodelitschia bisporula TaxID=703511 RepID=A0A6G1HI42_9PEZI|nr:hypothetical protein EJ06DRAFT_269561 [Trichodelitschia bisporula]